MNKITSSVAGAVGAVFLAVALSACGSSGGTDTPAPAPTSSQPATIQPTHPVTPTTTPPTTAPPIAGAADSGKVVFKVWGNAPAGVLGSLDITYGSDSDSNTGHFKDGTFSATLPYDQDAMYYAVTAQLQGSGDVKCSVTVEGQVKTGHAAGGYNICDAQLSGFAGDWS
jgi:hypothetical protein